MANLQSIRKRISSVRNTQQLTRAMKMVAAARLRRVQDKVSQSRPFAAEVLKMIKQVLEKVQHPETLSPFLSKSFHDNNKIDKQIHTKQIRLLVVGSDRGLCGAYNANIQKKITQIIQELTQLGHQVSVDTIGKRIFEYIKTHHATLPIHWFQDFHSDFSRLEAVRLMNQYRSQYLEGQFNEFGCVYTEFRSAISQKVRCDTLLPITPEMILTSMGSKKREDLDFENRSDAIFEPSIVALTQDLVVSFLDSRFYQTILDAIASEHGARMTAMENATKNAKEMIEKLTLYYNKQRQAKITNELLDIVGGVEAMNQ